MWRSSSAYFSRLQGGKWSEWNQMESTGQAETTPMLKIYAYGGEIKLKN
ncbi:hypothetical protein PMIN01_08237 [Paraphaeosphaeria minitans]|uniref:Uncharacterized protein n=1 Tax=Paraphaeosphaeria minitans TaxID=565426 RepID=A0A9P6GGT4_9PLEO|nr:hypothetical protein PMIN01_13491 [Paraphaeosphaeria minitans]KAF9733894.1 hypothetical protein PMIN01_08237 [Paraphaeosphaeria minitans]